MPELRGCDLPVRTGPSLHVRRLEANETIRVIILSSRQRGLWSHWLGRSSLPCTLPRQSCKGCLAQTPTRQKFLLHVANQGARQMEIIELPPAAMQDLLDVFPPGQVLRGETLMITRGNAKTARLKIRLEEAYAESMFGPLQPEIDPRIPLLELWGIDPKTVSFAQ